MSTPEEADWFDLALPGQRCATAILVVDYLVALDSFAVSDK